MIGCNFVVFLSREAKCLLASLAFNAMGGNNFMLFLTRQHQIDWLHIQRQRCAVLLAPIVSPVRYIQPLEHWRKIMKHRETKDKLFYMFKKQIPWYIFWDMNAAMTMPTQTCQAVEWGNCLSRVEWGKYMLNICEIVRVIIFRFHPLQKNIAVLKLVKVQWLQSLWYFGRQELQNSLTALLTVTL